MGVRGSDVGTVAEGVALLSLGTIAKSKVLAGVHADSVRMKKSLQHPLVGGDFLERGRH